MVQARRKYSVIPATKSFCDLVMIDEMGYYWLRRHNQDNPGVIINFDPTYRVLSPDGEYLGDTILPHLFLGASITRGHLITPVVSEETESVEYVIYRIKPAISGFKFP